MINKTDLRIGNSVMYKGEVYQVEELQEDDVTLFNSAFGWEKLDYSDVHPIPITEEALCKMGAVKIEDKRYNLESMIINIMHGKFIEYVHQIELKGIHHLQNLYYYTRLTELTYEP